MTNTITVIYPSSNIHTDLIQILHTGSPWFNYLGEPFASWGKYIENVLV